MGYIREFGPKLIGNGYLVCDIAPGKKACIRRGWADNPLSAQACRQHPEGEGVGILCGKGDNPVYAVDVDFAGTALESSELYDAICMRVPKAAEAIYRVGRPGRFLLIFRAEARWAKATTSWYDRDGKSRTRMEILGDGQQFVAYHTHPDTLAPYSYPFAGVSGTPADRPVADLPCVTREDLDGIREAFEEYLEQVGFERVDNSSVPLVDRTDWAAEELCPKRPVGLKLDEVRSIFVRTDWDWSSYDKWMEGGMRIHHETGGSPEGLALWDELSATAPNYGGFEACAKKWASFHRSEGGGAVTMWPLAKRTGYLCALATDLSEAGLMYRVIRDYGDCIVYFANTRSWGFFNRETRLWEEDRADAFVGETVMARVIQSALQAEIDAEQDEERAEAILDFRNRCLRDLSRTVSKVKSLLTNMPQLVVSPNDFDRDPTAIAVRNGIVDLATGKLSDNTPERRMRKYCDLDYDPNATCPTWRAAIDDWFESPAVGRYVQKVVGKMLAGNPEDDAFYILVGEGANGKSCFTDTLRRMMSSYAKALAEGTIMGVNTTAGGGSRSDLADLQGKRFAYCSETGERAVLKTADVKRFTGNDVISMRAPYGKKDQEYLPQFTLFMATNFEPELRGADNAIRRRVKLIRFPKDYENDPAMRAKRVLNLAGKLESELPGILNWALEGYRMAKAEGLEPPPEVRDASNSYVDSQDLVARWFAERCVEKEGSRVTLKDAFHSCMNMLEAQNETTSWLTQATFTRRLKRLLDRCGKPTAVTRSNGTVLRGYELRHPAEEDTSVQEEI